MHLVIRTSPRYYSDPFPSAGPAEQVPGQYYAKVIGLATSLDSAEQMARDDVLGLLRDNGKAVQANPAEVSYARVAVEGDGLVEIKVDLS